LKETDGKIRLSLTKSVFICVHLRLFSSVSLVVQLFVFLWFVTLFIWG